VPACLVLGDTAQCRALQPRKQRVVRRAVALGAPCRQARCERSILQVRRNVGEGVAQLPVLPAAVNARQQPGGLDDLAPPTRRIVATAAEAAAQFRHHADGVIDGPCHAGNRHARPGGPVREVGADADDDHAVTALRNSELLGTDDEVGGLRGLLQLGPAVRHPDRPHLVAMPLTSAERGEVLHQHLEDQATLDRRGQHAFHIFHDEGRGAQAVEHADVFAEEIVPLVFFGDVSDFAGPPIRMVSSKSRRSAPMA